MKAIVYRNPDNEFIELDLKGIDDDHKRIGVFDDIRQAAETWGICQLINHGVRTDVINEQPLKVKKKFVERNAKQLVKLLAGVSLIMKFSDMMQIISNDKFKGEMHRVVFGPTTRTSISCLFGPSSSKMYTHQYGPLKEIVHK
ncbi:hypothetical protein ACFE04_016203 [Oxalis oulophora]